jgi:hypothetical protein
MSASDTAASTRQNTALVVHDTVPADYPAIREVTPCERFHGECSA